MLLERCARVAAEGVDYLLIREKTLGAAELLRLTREVVAVCGGRGAGGTKVLVGRRADVALAGGAAGVHLTSSPGEVDASEVRLVFAGALVSQSCHSANEVSAAAGAGVDLILFGPVFGKVATGVVVVAPVGLPALAHACASAGGVPVLALGGVTPANAAECVAAGAAGVASIRMYFGAERGGAARSG